mmetsp:Transcript_45642/g.146484  ORF Transcript_45642/g.146484 Transcript_45642/m.146484 type:complete len:246 (+) Transcript_45642:428-1165(+)
MRARCYSKLVAILQVSVLQHTGKKTSQPSAGTNSPDTVLGVGLAQPLVHLHAWTSWAGDLQSQRLLHAGPDAYELVSDAHGVGPEPGGVEEEILAKVAGTHVRQRLSQGQVRVAQGLQVRRRLNEHGAALTLLLCETLAAARLDVPSQRLGQPQRTNRYRRAGANAGTLEDGVPEAAGGPAQILLVRLTNPQRVHSGLHTDAAAPLQRRHRCTGREQAGRVGLRAGWCTSACESACGQNPTPSCC